MARDVITVQPITKAGLTPAAAVTGVAANDLQFTCTTTNTFIEVENAHATDARVVSVVTSLEPGGFVLADLDVSVPALGRKLIWPFGDSTPLEFYDQGSGVIHIDISNDTDLTFSVFSLS